ncbi:hypothetical protein ASU33_14485 [Solirubrum puertoriconensis]|uniref:Heme NO-binding domain-containing protein n=2 Tax=Solirubrum puertoriconensis TaxID=1751427 RepID=A0A9X0L4F1_SOLP1|nr:hypothetical protein ASU33_14485 [Solirubrum puertoriconensis]
MHGSIFALLRRFVQTQYDHSMWVRVLEASGLPGPTLTTKRCTPTNTLMWCGVRVGAPHGAFVGIVRGLAAYSDEAERIDIKPTTRDDGQHVHIRVRRLP